MDSRNIEVREVGVGRPVLVLHGGPGPDGVAPLVDHLAASHHVLAPVHPGWAGTTRPPDLDSVPRLAAAYRRLLTDRGIADTAIIGTSFGGWVAAELTAQLAETGGSILVPHLILIDSIGPQIDGYDLRPPQPPTDAPPTGPARGPSPAALAALAAYTTTGLTDPTLLPRLAAATPSTTLIWGEHDTIAPLAYAQAIQAALPTATLTSIPNAGHTPYREQPHTVCTILDHTLSTST